MWKGINIKKLIRQDEKNEDLLHKTTNQHMVMAKTHWKYKLKNQYALDLKILWMAWVSKKIFLYQFFHMNYCVSQWNECSLNATNNSLLLLIIFYKIFQICSPLSNFSLCIACDV